MKATTLLLLLISCAIGCVNQDNKAPTKAAKQSSDTTTTSYDPQLAEELGADEYGMKKYVVAFLRKGPNRDMPDEDAQKLQAAHMTNINQLAEDGKLVLAGPFFGDGDLRGIYVFDVATIAEAEALTNTDPAIQAGSLIMELHEWYGSAAIMQINDIHQRITKTEI